MAAFALLSPHRVAAAPYDLATLLRHMKTPRTTTTTTTAAMPR